MGVGLVLIAVLAVAFVIVLRPTTGQLVVTVSGPANEELDQVEVYLDGGKVCDKSPCTLEEVEDGTHTIKANAPGYKRTADIAISVAGGAKAVHNIQLAREGGTGIKVTAEGKGLKLFVDGKEIGPLPQEVDNLEPGEHKIKVAGNPRYDEYEQSVEVAAGTVQTIGPLKLKVLQGLAKIQPGEGAEKAQVILDSDGDRRVLPRLPITLQIDTSKPHKVTATRRGYEDFSQELAFEDGAAEKTFTIELEEADEDDTPKNAARTSRRATQRARTSRSSSAGKATLNINSIPSSSIILDGRPLGSTPKIGVSVSAGKHTVVFVKGSDRKTTSVNVKAGETRTVAVRL